MVPRQLCRTIVNTLLEVSSLLNRQEDFCCMTATLTYALTSWCILSAQMLKTSVTYLFRCFLVAICKF